MPREFEWQEETLGAEDFYRGDIEDLLQDGAWQEGFNEWVEYTTLDEEHVDSINDQRLFQAFDFYWDPSEDRLRFDAPRVPDEWQQEHPIESRDSITRSLIAGELADLGHAVLEVLEGYLDRNDEDSDYGWGADTYGTRDE
ncbi:hypothetical protein SAMN05192561_10921 [Halopenitus malekzadehii]|uniref:DUF7992 domain-containing protein n=2 Tax=Halopenitus malekzadehii TaxID=1267564 RepID=A0A1H6J7V2_9EURY|nr:hypothetical protein SAMN05192561_10921 [Halopenitus malekzadehii]